MHILRVGAVVVACGAVACGPSGKGTVEKPPVPKDSVKITLPEVPAPVDTEIVEPRAGHADAARSPVFDALEAEIARWAVALADRPLPAYYLAYQVVDRHGVIFEAEEGKLLRDDDEQERLLDVEVRVGSPEFDNRRPIRSDKLMQQLTGVQREVRMPFGTDAEAIRHAVWLETDRRYREAALQFRVVATEENKRNRQEKQPPDFAAAEPSEYYQPEVALEVDKAKWIDAVRDCSERSNRGVATRSTCRVDFLRTTTYFVNSEGSRIQQSWTDARFTVSVGVKADDGMPLSRVETHYARGPEGLPTAQEIEQMIVQVNADLDALHGAPVVDPYSGPAILEGRAAAVFFHEVFGHRIEGHRQKDETSGQTFSSKLGQQIMPAWLTVYDDPRIKELNGEFLNGFYRFDDEGVNAQRAMLVENGVLEGFVQGRNPLENMPLSNGHGRKEPGLWPVSRQGNLVVEAARSVPQDELTKLLIAEVNRQGKPYGMKFTDISGGFTNTSRFLPQSFKVNPIMAYRVYPDGREELVRGVDIEGTPLIALGSIVAASRDMEVFNGMCGAESGWVPVSASAPSLMLRQLEVARSTNLSGSSPTLPPPSE